MIRKALLLLLFFLPVLSSFGQSADKGLFKIHVRNIVISGNRRTRERVILRALTFAPGDSLLLGDLTTQLEVSRNNIINTALFYDVKLELKNWAGSNLDVYITVIERGYTIPLPYADLYDRNFNNWWVVNHHDLHRVQYGINFLQKNVGGLNQDLRITALLGFAQKFSVSYYIPFFDRKQKEGLQLSASYDRNYILSYATVDNKQLFYLSDKDVARMNWSAKADWIIQPGFHVKHVFSASYNKAFISDTIARLNPDYFLNGRKFEEYITLSYVFSRTYVDIKAYPLHGSYAEAGLYKIGLPHFENVDMTVLTLIYNKYIPLGGKLYFSWENKVKYSLPNEQPYYNQRALGYRQDYVSGYEYYVIDGQQFGLTKLNLKYQLVKGGILNPWTKGLIHVSKLPFTIYARAQLNAAYVNDDYYFKGNPLNNTLLIGGGPAIDVVMFYDITASIQYSWNLKGEGGLFLHASLLLF